MSKKTLVLFTSAFGVYTRGDVAGFDFETAKDLIDVKKVAAAHEVPADPEVDGKTETVTLKIDSAETQAEIARQIDQAKADLATEAQARSDALDAREAKIVERETALASAEADLAKRSEALAAKENAEPDSDAGETKTSKQPPKQGGK